MRLALADIDGRLGAGEIDQGLQLGHAGEALTGLGFGVVDRMGRTGALRLVPGLIYAAAPPDQA